VSSALIGVGIGLVVAFWAARLIERFLFGIGRTDPATYLGVVAFLVLVCLGAAWLPARRISKIAPMEVIAEE